MATQKSEPIGKWLDLISLFTSWFPFSLTDGSDWIQVGDM